MMFAIIPNLTRKNAAQVTRLICAKLDELGAAYSLPLGTEDVFSDTKAEFLPEKELLGGCEAVITVGGDGTIIHSAKKAAVYSKPVLGINAGRLAFMAGLEIHELDLLEKLITGDYSMDKRMMLKTTAADGDSVQSGYSMNDSTVMRLSRLSRISEINVDLDGRYFNRYLGDGLRFVLIRCSPVRSFWATMRCCASIPMMTDLSPSRAMATSRSPSRRRGA